MMSMIVHFLKCEEIAKKGKFIKTFYSAAIMGMKVYSEQVKYC